MNISTKHFSVSTEICEFSHGVWLDNIKIYLIND